MKKLFVFAVLTTVLSIDNITYAQTVEEVAFYTCSNMLIYSQDITIKPHSFRNTLNGNEELRPLFPPILANFTCPGTRGVTGRFNINQWSYRYISFEVKVGDTYLYTGFADRYLNKRIYVSIEISRINSPAVKIVYE